MERPKMALAVLLLAVALALAVLSISHSFGPRSQWGSNVPNLTGGGPPAPTPAPLPPGLQGR